MPRVTYKGLHSATLLNYTDLATGYALSVEPGGTYDIQAINGPDIPSDFVLADVKKTKKSLSDFSPASEVEE